MFRHDTSNGRPEGKPNSKGRKDDGHVFATLADRGQIRDYDISKDAHAGTSDALDGATGFVHD